MNLSDETRAQLDALMRDGVAWFWQSHNSELLLTKHIKGHSLNLIANIEYCTRLQWEVSRVYDATVDHEALEGFNPRDETALLLLSIMAQCLLLFARTGEETPIVSFEQFQKTCDEFLAGTPRRYNYSTHNERFQVNLGLHGEVCVMLWFRDGLAKMSVNAYSIEAVKEQMKDLPLIVQAHALMVHLNNLWGVKLRE